MNLLHNLFKIKYCKLSRDDGLTEYFQKITTPLNLRYVFNPSFYCDDDVKIFAFRAISAHNDYNLSFVSIEDKTGQTVKNISIDLYKELNGVRLIDPKVVKINKEFYITFNSGWIRRGNDIFIMRIYPEIEPPKKLIYKNRQNQERNWSFFSEGGEIYVLYWINPLKILKVKNTSSTSWEMEDYYCEAKKNNSFSNDLTIGTQLSKLENKYYFIGHKKLYFLRKKIYIGKFCELDFNRKKINSGKYWLVHSLKSVLGSTTKDNKNLFSCTYFSGIQVSKDSVKLGYGVNDVIYGFSTHKLEDL